MKIALKIFKSFMNKNQQKFNKFFLKKIKNL